MSSYALPDMPAALISFRVMTCDLRSPPSPGEEEGAQPSDSAMATRGSRRARTMLTLLEDYQLYHYGRGGIRTHGALLTHTHFPGVRLKPLGHPSRLQRIQKPALSSKRPRAKKERRSVSWRSRHSHFKPSAG